MAAERISVLVVDGSPEQAERLTRMIAAHDDLVIAGSVGHGAEAVERIPIVRPDIVLVDRQLVDADGFSATEAIVSQYPWVSVIMLSGTADPDDFRRAMLAGARQLLNRPFTETNLAGAIRQVYQRRAAGAGAAAPPPSAEAPAGPPMSLLSQGTLPAPALAPGPAIAPAASIAPAAKQGAIYTFYSAKGGVGCTTLACNLAVALKQRTGKEVALFDCGLLFGDVGVVLNIDPRQTIVDLLPRSGDATGRNSGIDADVLRQVMVTHSSGVKVLLAPASPEKAELIAPEHVARVLALLREQFDYVVIDTWPTFEERILHVLDTSDHIVVPTTLEMPAIKNCKLLLDVASALAYPPEKIALVLNRANSRGGIRVHDVEQILQKRFFAEIVSDGRLTTHSLNEGVPFVMTNPDAPISANVVDLACRLAGVPAPATGERQRPRQRAGGLLRAVGSVFGA
ncbi:MAG: response regulator [Chloroflexi bacterium]|nr:response regulator [Chloroflexota bacterium]